MLTQQSFGLTCKLGNDHFVAFLSDNVVPNTLGPLVKLYESDGVSFGKNYSVGFDAASIALDATPVLGDLIIRSDQLWLAAHRAPSANAFGGKCIVCLDTGDIANSFPTGAVVKRWSIAVGTQHKGAPSEVFARH
jgi:hypothetical protein